MRIFLQEAYSLIAYMHKYAEGVRNFGRLFEEKSQDFVKTLRRLIKNIQDFFLTKPWIVQTKSDIALQNHFFSAIAFVKIFRIFYARKKWVSWGRGRAEKINFV